MEKQRNSKKSKSCSRLLICTLFIVFFTATLSAQKLKPSQIKQLKIEPAENQKMYAKTELKFQVVIPGVPASFVQVQNPLETKGVTFKTLRKTELYSGSTDTKIELWFVFDKKGTYKLKPLTIVLSGRTYNLDFSEVNIDNDPANMPARFVIKFENKYIVYSDNEITNRVIFDAVVGEKVNYTIYLQHAVQLVQFTWELPKDSIFSQTKSYDIAENKYREKTISEELIPVASFEWISLTEGQQPMPQVRLTATGYNGYRTALKMPEFYINFKKNNVKETNEADVIFVDAFNSNYIHTNKVETTEITDENCERIAELRRAEKCAFLNLPQARKERKEFEESLNLPSSQGEYPVCILHISILVLIILIILFIIFTKNKRILAKIILTVVIILNLVIIISSSVQTGRKFAIFKQGTILSIPDETATVSNEISAGTRVRILEETDEWSYIEVGEIGGWVKKDRLCEI